ncbi:hypothetical protein FB45DRAFT_918780 [Roridomyces roridus]|uniref:DNA polymerase lambda n=1 Tax=Roridomyces roridus TaxID=1738132 RepID=A0AAD7BRP9_9AGAR|nr:hypothetical protein FB45DRAFT_918780 [Roridomyces roridus]
MDIDIDAFFKEQEQQMNEPEDDEDEFLARMQRIRNPAFPTYSFNYDDIKMDFDDSLDQEEGPSTRKVGPSKTNAGRDDSRSNRMTVDSMEDVQSSHSKHATEMRLSNEAPISVVPGSSSSRKAEEVARDRGLVTRTRKLEPHDTEEDVHMRSVSPEKATRKSPRRSKPAPAPLRAPSPPSIPQITIRSTKLKQPEKVVLEDSLIIPDFEDTSDGSSGMKTPTKPLSTKAEMKTPLVPPKSLRSTRKSPRLSNPASSPPPLPKLNLKRKESPTKPEQPSRKKVALDEGLLAPSSPKPAAKPKSKPASSKPKSRAKKPEKPVAAPATIDLSMDTDPIEEPDFSIVVSRFEPEAESTQPQKPLGAGSTFLEIEELIDRRTREKKLLKAASRGSKSTVASTSNVTKPKPKPLKGEESVILIPSPPASEPKNVIVPIKASTSKAKTKAKEAKPVPAPKPAPLKKGSAASKKKEKEKILPKDYAQKLQDNPPPLAKRKSEQYLRGMNLFYYGGDMTFASDKTMKRMDLIKHHGGELSPTFDPEVVTHIVVDAHLPPFLRSAGVQKLKEIPEWIPIISWNWVAQGAEGHYFEYAVFKDRIAPVVMPERPGKGKGKERASDGDLKADESRISDFTQDKKGTANNHDSEADQPNTKPGLMLSPPASPKASGSGGKRKGKVKVEDKDDPLAEFYKEAREEQSAEVELGLYKSGGGYVDVVDVDETDKQKESRDNDTDESDVESPAPSPQKNLRPGAKRTGWTCDDKNVQPPKNGPNEDIAKKFEILKRLHEAKMGEDHHWKAFSYRKSIGPIRRHPTRIKSYKEARTIPNVGHKTALKIMEIVKTGKLSRIDYENTPDVKVRAMFQNIYGVGPKTAYQWYAAGLRTLDDLLAGRGGVTLNPGQRIGIQYYDDIQERMPRTEAKALFDIIKPVALAIDPKLEIEIMGSYRRGKADCGDIDIMITRNPDDGGTHAGVLRRLLNALHKKKIIEEDLALPEDPNGEEAIYRGLCHLPEPGSKRRRIDFLTVPWKNRGAALLYYTGDDIFNRAIRLKANVMGYSLNQRGLFEGVVRKPGNRQVKTNSGTCIAGETEEEIFRVLDVPFQAPHERVRG